MFDRVLIANRGEIACRVTRTVHRMDGEVVAVYSDPDEHAPHVRAADATFRLPGCSAEETYLNIERLLDVARKANVDAIHPGYGFLSENPDFARAVRDANLTFVGPSADVIEAMGMKRRAKNLMEEAGVPVVPDERGENQDAEHLATRAEELGFPVLIKAVAGGGGKGMRKVDRPDRFHDELEACRREAKKAFGDGRVLIEKYITEPRHVEVQVFGDRHGNAAHLFERDCSIQRRYQKIIEEAPAPGLSDSLRQQLGETALRAVDKLDYTNAGTMEFILDASSDTAEDAYYFMEMNTRLQVEHPVTEMVTGEDLVEWQLRVAAGEPLPRDTRDLSVNGHAVEARLYAEDPAAGFQPRTGPIERFVHPEETGQVRLDAGVDERTEVTVHYDPLLAKLVVHGADREEALRRMERVLTQTALIGVTTNMELLLNVIRHDAFGRGSVRTDFIDRHRGALIPDDYGTARRVDVLFAAVYELSGCGDRELGDAGWTDPWSTKHHWRMNSKRTTSLALRSGERVFELDATCYGRTYEFGIEEEQIEVLFQEWSADQMVLSIDGHRRDAVIVEGNNRRVTVAHDGRAVAVGTHRPALEADEPEGEQDVRSTMPGTIIDVLVEHGERVDRKQPVLVMEAMKMELTVQAERTGTVDEVYVQAGDRVKEGDVLVSIV